ncbi:sensor histidine kinase [Paludifilum halophilum]|uniref:histidine kinase n=1 Tax=Paludifilum halophilum TaxID=1642702 RepID=A0A235B694_9BACL|nr:ATP-binding protein [Paludifilum halophilum]OYD07826.1 histidine kinase [Paludifilum halophilum]
MKKTLRRRLTFAFVGVAVGIVLLASMVSIAETHYHFSMYQAEKSEGGNQSGLDDHFEQALIQSLLWTALGAVLLAGFLSWAVARRITSPLETMKKAAEKIAAGSFGVRVPVRGQDELAQLGDALNHLTHELQQQEDLRKKMTSDIAHELRTPLATLKSHMEAFEDGIWEPTPERLQSVAGEIERLIGLVDDLEQLTLVESPDFELQRKEEDLSEIARQGAQSVDSAFMQKGVDLCVEANQTVIVWVDRHRITQILVNLLSNALKFTPPGGQVTLQTKQENGTAILKVADTGEGMTEEETSRVFERFYRVDPSRNRKQGGSGIGLTIVKKLVESHGGVTRIQSDKEKGTEINIDLPVK